MRPASRWTSGSAEDYRLTPRIRDLGRVTLCRDDTKKATAARYPSAGPLLGVRLKEDLIAECWPDLLRTAGSLKYGEASASLVVGTWSQASRQNTLAAGLKEWGLLRRTIHAARYLSDPPFRRAISRQANKGESLHSLRRDLHYANQGSISNAQLPQQTEHARCLTVLTNAVVTWTTEYYALAVARLRSQGRDIPDDLLTHISPAHSHNVNYPLGEAGAGKTRLAAEASSGLASNAAVVLLRCCLPDASLLGRGGGCQSPGLRASYRAARRPGRSRTATLTARAQR